MNFTSSFSLTNPGESAFFSQNRCKTAQASATLYSSGVICSQSRPTVSVL